MWSLERSNDPHFTARIYRALEDKDQALAWLGKAYKGHHWGMVGLNGYRWTPFRSDPRFQDLLRRMRFPE